MSTRYGKHEEEKARAKVWNLIWFLVAEPSVLGDYSIYRSGRDQCYFGDKRRLGNWRKLGELHEFNWQESVTYPVYGVAVVEFAGYVATLFDRGILAPGSAVDWAIVEIRKSGNTGAEISLQRLAAAELLSGIKIDREPICGSLGVIYLPGDDINDCRANVVVVHNLKLGGVREDGKIYHFRSFPFSDLSTYCTAQAQANLEREAIAVSCKQKAIMREARARLTAAEQMLGI